MSSPIIKADLDEMVFEDRERLFGAYKLRKQYPGRLMLALGSVCLAFLLSAFAPATLYRLKGEKAPEKERLIVLADQILPPPPPMDEERKVEPPPKVEPPKLETLAFKIPDPTPSDELPETEPETLPDMDSLQVAVNLGLENQEGLKEPDFSSLFSGEGDGKVPDVVVEDTDPPIDMPNFEAEAPQAINLEDVKRMIGYPDIAKDGGIAGRVVVRVLVDKYGRYRKHKVIKKIHPVLSDAVEKQLSELRFTPAIQAGKPIPFWVNVPFNFVLLD